MSTKEKIQKMRGHTDLLIDAFLVLKERYMFVETALFSDSVVSAHNKNGKGRGLAKVTTDLYFFCIQDVAKLALDADKHSTSIKNLAEDMADPQVRATLRKCYSEQVASIPKDEPPEFQEFIRKENGRRNEEQAKEFDSRYDNLLADWEIFKKDKKLDAFKTIRDKLTAHYEAKYANGRYAAYDLESLGLKWADLGSTLKLIERYVVDLNWLIRQGSFAMKEFDTEVLKDAKAFWL